MSVATAYDDDIRYNPPYWIFSNLMTPVQKRHESENVTNS